MGDEGGGAYHLVGENSIDAVVVQMDQPIQALQLIVPHLSELDAGRLHCQAVPHLWAGQHNTQGVQAERVCAMKRQVVKP